MSSSFWRIGLVAPGTVVALTPDEYARGRWFNCASSGGVEARVGAALQNPRHNDRPPSSDIPKHEP
jgi:hypothetical protein